MAESNEVSRILRNFANDIVKIFGDSLCEIILYGSYARGDSVPGSDIDLMIITSMSDDEIRAVENQVYDLAYDYNLSENVLLSINIKNNRHFNYWLGALPYYDNVRREGVVLAS